ncbi:MAG TPA: hypothetical protein VNM92_01940 [Thermoanaerobaculia bacterium]|nr:hypothetical protein [Thermoanaerobaculia bacterium]
MSEKIDVPDLIPSSAVGINLAGADYDLGNVIYRVLTECEHRRRSFPADQAERMLLGIARQKLDELRPGYVELGGSAPYWESLEREVLGNVMPRYVRRGIEQTRLEERDYGVWRRGDMLARVLFSVGALTVGGIIIALPFIPVFENAFAFFSAFAAWFYPELQKTMHDAKHTRLLNRMVTEGQAYQTLNQKLLTGAALDEAFAMLPGRTPKPPRIDEDQSIH